MYKGQRNQSTVHLNGLKIRCMETKIYLSAYKALGVNATPMAWGELLTALQQGTVEAVMHR